MAPGGWDRGRKGRNDVGRVLSDKKEGVHNTMKGLNAGGDERRDKMVSDGD